MIGTGVGSVDLRVGAMRVFVFPSPSLGYGVVDTGERLEPLVHPRPRWGAGCCCDGTGRHFLGDVGDA